MLNKIVILDDETYVLDQLLQLIDWEQIGFEVYATLNDTKNIYDYIENNEIDAILSDISMPNPNGLDIAKYCHENHPDILL